MATRQNTFLIKRSNVAGKVPNAGSIQLGELALNTADVKLYASGTTSNSILPIGWDRIARTGDTMTGTLYVPTVSANTISATTYYGLPSTIDTYVTGFTYSNNLLTITQNQGQLPLNVLINTMSGLTVNGILSAITMTATTIGSNGMTNTGNTTNMVTANSGGTLTATTIVISAYNIPVSAQTMLSNTANWSAATFVATGLTGTYQGQRYYDSTYYYEAVADNAFIRLLRS